MNANKGLTSSILNNATLIEVPYFQRSYVWEEENWERFLEDMEFMVKTNSPHFFGSVILKNGGNPNPSDPYAAHYTVVDGQQRLTTLMIFMKVLCLKANQLTFFDGQFRLIMSKNGALVLQHGKNDIAAFENVMASNKAEIIDNPDPGSRIIEAFNYFVENCDATKLNIMSIMQNLEFVVINLDSNDDEQQIFDTINSLGVRLSTSELLKNYFFSNNINAYQNIWVPAFEKNANTMAYWDTVLEVGRYSRALIDIFFDAYFQLFIQDKKYNISSNDKVLYERTNHLAQSYRHFIDHYCGGKKSDVLDPLRDYALCFMDKFRMEYCEQAVPADFGIERINVIIFGLKTSTLIPYVLYVEENVSDQDEKNKIYGILESFIMRRMIVRATNKNYNNLFTSLIFNKVLDSDELRKRLNDAGTSMSSVPNDDELRDGFKNSKLTNLQAKGIIYLIESKIRPKNSSVALLGFNQYSLEHLMPKKWRNHWPACENAYLDQQRDSTLLTLGNLAIITQSLNASIRDSEWEVKKSGNSKHLGLERCASGLATLHDAILKDEWNEDEISRRSEWLCEQACKIWAV